MFGLIAIVVILLIVFIAHKFEGEELSSSYITLNLNEKDENIDNANVENDTKENNKFSLSDWIAKGLVRVTIIALAITLLFFIIAVVGWFFKKAWNFF